MSKRISRITEMIRAYGAACRASERLYSAGHRDYRNVNAVDKEYERERRLIREFEDLLREPRVKQVQFQCPKCQTVMGVDMSQSIGRPVTMVTVNPITPDGQASEPGGETK